ncbi:hypothetical protein [Halomarina litorea]|uniref:hypothetical protein n=1 Tax=Halomarina litorea TaxID=2961595 RepID=UPI0020C4462C|nr:hypothetical protein [Halomarina sp. BCD28]
MDREEPTNRERFERALRAAFDGSPDEFRAVSREVTDLADSGRYARDAGHDLTPETVVSHLRDAPDEGLPEKWNWWLGSLALAYGEGGDDDAGYAEFQVWRVER